MAATDIPNPEVPESDTVPAAGEEPAAGADPAAHDAARLREERDRALAEAQDCKDRLLRARAEFENVRRRSENDVANARKFGIERFAADLLAVRDSLELALSVELPHTEDPLLGRMLEGVVLTLKQLDGVFERYALEPVVPARGDRLDPERHQAMTTQPSEDVPAGHILTLVQRGYLLNGRLLRPALVIVASADAAGH